MGLFWHFGSLNYSRVGFYKSSMYEFISKAIYICTQLENVFFHYIAPKKNGPENNSWGRGMLGGGFLCSFPRQGRMQNILPHREAGEHTQHAQAQRSEEYSRQCIHVGSTNQSLQPMR